MNENIYRSQVFKYTYGFILSGILTLVVYFAVMQNWLAGGTMALFAILMAVAQFIVQVKFFLHIGDESGPRWKTYGFAFTILCLLIIVVGSLWIMSNLNYNMHATPEQMTEYMKKQNTKGF